MDLGSRDGRSRARVAGGEHDAHRDQLVGGRDRLLAIAVIVGRDQLHLLAEHAARGIQVGHRERHAALRLFGEPRVRSGERHGQSDQDLGMDERGEAECCRKGNNQRSEQHGLGSRTVSSDDRWVIASFRRTLPDSLRAVFAPRAGAVSAAHME